MWEDDEGGGQEPRPELGSLSSHEAAQSPAPCLAVMTLIDWDNMQAVCPLPPPEHWRGVPFADMRGKRPRKSRDRKGAIHTDVSSGRGQETENRAQKWEKESKKGCHTPGRR